MASQDFLNTGIFTVGNSPDKIVPKSAIDAAIEIKITPITELFNIFSIIEYRLFDRISD